MMFVCMCVVNIIMLVPALNISNVVNRSCKQLCMLQFLLLAKRPPSVKTAGVTNPSQYDEVEMTQNPAYGPDSSRSHCS